MTEITQGEFVIVQKPGAGETIGILTEDGTLVQINEMIEAEVRREGADVSSFLSQDRVFGSHRIIANVKAECTKIFTVGRGYVDGTAEEVTEPPRGLPAPRKEIGESSVR